MIGLFLFREPRSSYSSSVIGVSCPSSVGEAGCAGAVDEPGSSYSSPVVGVSCPPSDGEAGCAGPIDGRACGEAFDGPGSAGWFKEHAFTWLGRTSELWVNLLAGFSIRMGIDTSTHWSHPECPLASQLVRNLLIPVQCSHAVVSFFEDEMAWL